MADIKERKKDTSSIKEKRTSMPKELLKLETIHSIQWARQQVQEAAEPEQQEGEGAGAGMPRLRVPQIRQHSRSNLKRETHDNPTTAGKSTTESSIMSTDAVVESAPSKVQESYTHAQEQGRKLAIRQETERPRESRSKRITYHPLMLFGKRNPTLLHCPILFGNDLLPALTPQVLFGKFRLPTLTLQLLFGKGPLLHLLHLL